MRRLMFLSLVLLTSCALFLLPACTLLAVPPPVLTPLTVQLKWLHQAQFAGFYAADQNGYYAEEGLKVNFIEGGQRWIWRNQCWMAQRNSVSLVQKD